MKPKDLSSLELANDIALLGICKRLTEYAHLVAKVAINEKPLNSETCDLGMMFSDLTSASVLIRYLAETRDDYK
jgi:hypothetical protein